MFRICVLFFLVSFYSIAHAQSPGTSNVANLATDSSAIVTGSVEQVVWVVNRDKMISATRPSASGKIKLPNLDEFVVGRLYRVRIRELIKADETIKKDQKFAPGNVVNIFAPWQLADEGSPAFVEKENYLIFLLPLEADDQKFAGTIVHRPGAPSSEGATFNSRQVYRVVGDASGAILLSQKSGKILAEVRSLVRKGR